MLINGEQLPQGVELQTDVAIVGAGPVALTLAEHLAGPQCRVMLIEAGGQTETSPATSLLKGESVGQPISLTASRRKAFAGTSSHWTEATGLRVRPFDWIDFEARPGVRETSWPIPATEMAAAYQQAHYYLGLANDYRPERWPNEARAGLPQAMFQFAPHRVFVEKLDAMKAAQYVEVVLNSSVTELRRDDESTAVGKLEVRCLNGNAFSVRARVVVLAGGTIENARLLLASRSDVPAGLGNESDNVGRYFMDHPSIDAGFIAGLSGPSLAAARAFAESRDAEGVKHQPMLWPGEKILEKEGLLNGAFWISLVHPSFASPGVQAARRINHLRTARPARRALAGAIATAVTRPYPVARFAWDKARRRTSGTTLALRVLTEQVPRRDSRVTLSERRDAVGMPLARVDWRISEQDVRSVRRLQEVARDQLRQAGIGELDGLIDPTRDDLPFVSNYHHLGTTRMHRDAQHGVVDADLRVHTVPNLFICGGSVFPTGGYVNPTLTMVALAIRLARTVSAEVEATPIHA